MNHLPKPSDAKRSALMGRVRQRGTAAEILVGRALRSLGVGYRLNVKSLPGSPDFANRSRKWAVFVNGCFWHHHTACSRATKPKANADFWRDKFKANRSRDAAAVRALRASGFRVVILWECQVMDDRDLAARASKVLEPRRIDMS
jgi:DNA mismatch endonuclease (patch repair protein)